MFKIDYSYTDAFKYFLAFIVYGLLGLLIGRLVQRLFEFMQGLTTDPWKCFGYLVLQIAFITVLLFFANTFLIFKSRSFVKWILETPEGFLFASLFIENQSRLVENIRQIIK